MVTAEEFGNDYSRIISRLDQDGDGAVTMEELRQRGERRHHGRGGDGEGDRG
jgi:hypothetical protein